MAFAFYLTNPVCGLLGSVRSSAAFHFESDHNSEVWSCAADLCLEFFYETMNVSNKCDLCETIMPRSVRAAFHKVQVLLLSFQR